MTEQTSSSTEAEEVNCRIKAIDTTVGLAQCGFGVISATLNVLVIIGFIRLGLKGKIANILYCALSFSDTITGLSSIVYSILILDTRLDLLTGDESFFNVFKLREGFLICVWLGPLFAFSMMMTISLINAITCCRTFAVAAPFYYKIYLTKSVVFVVVFLLATHAFFIGVIPLINNVHVYFLDAHSGICAIIPLPGLDRLLKHLQLAMVTIPITLHCAMVFCGTLLLLHLLQKRRNSVRMPDEKSSLLSRCCSTIKGWMGRRSSEKTPIHKKPTGCSTGQSNAAQVDKATARAEKTVIGLLTSFTITYSFWLVGFYMQVHATNQVELPAAWFGITPHVSYYMFRGNEAREDAAGETSKNCSAPAEQRYFMFTAYGPILLVVLVILNSMVNPIVHLVFNTELRRAVFSCKRPGSSNSSNPNSHASLQNEKILALKRNSNKQSVRSVATNITTASSNPGGQLSCPTLCVQMSNPSSAASSAPSSASSEPPNGREPGKGGNHGNHGSTSSAPAGPLTDTAMMERDTAMMEREFQFLEQELEEKGGGCPEKLKCGEGADQVDEQSWQADDVFENSFALEIESRF